MDSCDSFTIKPPWVGDFGTIIKIRSLCENVELVHALNNFFVES